MTRAMLYPTVLWESRLDLAQDLYRRGHPVIISKDSFDNLVNHSMWAVGWAIQHIRPADLDRVSLNLEHMLTKDSAHLGLLRRVTEARVGRRMAPGTWRRINKHLLYPRSSADQLEWRPPIIGQSIDARKRLIDQALDAALSGNMARYIRDRL